MANEIPDSQQDAAKVLAGESKFVTGEPSPGKTELVSVSLEGVTPVAIEGGATPDLLKPPYTYTLPGTPATPATPGDTLSAYDLANAKTGYSNEMNRVDPAVIEATDRVFDGGASDQSPVEPPQPQQ